MHTLRVFFFGAFLCTEPSLAGAEPGATDNQIELSPFDHAGWSVAASAIATVMHFHYEEHAPAAGAPVVDQHTAVLPGAQLEAEVASPRSRFYAHAALALTNGSMDYVGMTQGGEPLTGHISGYSVELEAVVGARGRLSRQIWLGGYAGLGHDAWRRDLRPLGRGGYLEEYSWAYLPIGLRIDVAPIARLTLSADGAVLIGKQNAFFTLPLPGSIHFSHLEQFDDADIGLATGAGGRLQITGGYAIAQQWQVIGVLRLDSMQIDNGPTSPLTHGGQPVLDGSGAPIGLAEPSSHTSRYGMSVGASYTF